MVRVRRAAAVRNELRRNAEQFRDEVLEMRGGVEDQLRRLLWRECCRIAPACQQPLVNRRIRPPQVVEKGVVEERETVAAVEVWKTEAEAQIEPVL